MNKLAVCILSSVAAVGVLSGCATEESRSLAVAKPAAAARPYSGNRTLISVGKFDNRSSFMRGIFTDGDLRRLIDAGQADFLTTPVGTVMQPAAKTIAADRLAAEAVKVMEANKINGLLVLDTNGKLAGALNMHDLFRAGVV